MLFPPQMKVKWKQMLLQVLRERKKVKWKVSLHESRVKREGETVPFILSWVATCHSQYGNFSWELSVRHKIASNFLLVSKSMFRLGYSQSFPLVLVPFMRYFNVFWVPDWNPRVPFTLCCGTIPSLSPWFFRFCFFRVFFGRVWFGFFLFLTDFLSVFTYP